MYLLQGCYSVVIDSIKAGTKIFMGCAIGLASFQVFIIYFLFYYNNYDFTAKY